MDKPIVSIVMGSVSDSEKMRGAVEILKEFNIPFEVRIISAHRTPDIVFEYAKNAVERGIEVIIAGAGGSAHLPGVLASLTTIPVIGVPIDSSKNAAILSIRILSIKYPQYKSKLEDYALRMKKKVLESRVEY